jgi:hypothetical protein
MESRWRSEKAHRVECQNECGDSGDPVMVTISPFDLTKGVSMSIQIYDPTTEVTGRRIAFAPRPKSLEGLRIGLVDNTKHNSDQLLLRIAGLLERDHGAKAHVIRRKKSAGAAPHAEIITELKGSCDVIVAGVGD